MSRETDLTELRRLVYVMDSLFEIPVIKRRVGLDGLIGLIPGLGDLVGLAISSYLIFKAARMRVSNAVLARMIVNIMFDASIGTIPFLGDVVDFFFKANRRNLSLLESSALNPNKTHKRSVGFLILIGVILIAIFVAVAWGAVLVIQSLWTVFQNNVG